MEAGEGYTEGTTFVAAAVITSKFSHLYHLPKYRPQSTHSGAAGKKTAASELAVNTDRFTVLLHLQVEVFVLPVVLRRGLRLWETKQETMEQSFKARTPLFISVFLIFESHPHIHPTLCAARSPCLRAVQHPDTNNAHWSVCQIRMDF